MPQTRDTAPQQPAANGGAPPVTETRVDAAHSIGDAISAPLLADLTLAEMPLADIPLADIAVEQAISEFVRVEGSVQVRAQADQLGVHLRERQRQLEHRESQVNARVAAFEQEIRDARAWLARRNEELNERESRLEARETAIKVPVAGTPAQVASPTEPLRGVPKPLERPADRPMDAARAGPFPDDGAELAKPTARSGPPSFDRPRAFDEPRPSAEPISIQEPISFQEPVSFDGPLGDTEWNERKRTLTRVSQQLDRRRQALEEFHNEISQMHHEALELHLITQELRAQLRPLLGVEAEEALRSAREKMARRYHKEETQLIRQRKELECLRSELAKEHAKLTRRYQELKGWIEDQRSSEAAGKTAVDARGARCPT